MAIKAIINNTEKEIEQIKNSNEQDIDYVYSRIGDTEVEGESSISIKSIGENLANYRIYGNTVDGESVGDRTANLWDETIIQGGSNNTGTIIDGNPKRLRSDYIFVEPGETYSFASNLKIRLIYSYDDNNQKVSLIRDAPIGDRSYTFTVPNAATKIIITVMKRINNVEYDITPDDFEWGMLNTGSEPLPYEPYGYRVPVTVEGKNLCNNIWEQKAINVETGNPTPSAFNVCCDFIPVKPNVTYSCSRTIANNYNNLRCYGTNKNYLGTGADLADKANPLKQGELFGTFMITDARVSYIRFNDLSNSLDTKYMLVEGVYTAETMPPYEPYHAPVTTNLYLPEPIKIVGDEAEYIDYKEQKQHRVRKNLLLNTATSQGSNGVTFTVNSDGSVTCNGTASATTFFTCSSNITISKKAVLTGCPNDGGVFKYLIKIQKRSTADTIVNDIGVGSGEFYQTDPIDVVIRIAKGYTCDNLTFYPMIRKADIKDDTYEPYIENTDLDVTLPALPTIKGTNTLSVNTSIQPSNMYIKDNFDYKRIFTATRAIEDELPLNYKNIEDNDSTLSNYRIYGNTVDGESVGDRTANLFDGTFIHRSVVSANVSSNDPNRRSIAINISSLDNGNKITFSRKTSAGNQFQMYQVTSPLTGGRLKSDNLVSDNPETLLAAITLGEIARYPYLMIFLNGATNTITDEELLATNIMLNTGTTALPYEPYGYRVPVTTERSVPHTATLQLHDCLPSNMQFDAPEALYYAENGLTAGTYNFTIQDGYDTSFGGGKTYQFTLANDVPVKGQLVFGWDYDTLASDAKITSYASSTSTTAIEQVGVTEGSGGTSLGTTDGNSTNVNHIHRARYGSNNYKESAIRQFLNSSAVAGSVWTPQTKYDRPPSWNSNTAGFMKDIDSDFLAVLGASPKVVALNTVTDGGGSVTINNDKFFLLSRSEVYGGKENNINEGEPYPYYSNYSDLSTAGTGDDSNRIKYGSGTAQFWWLRSPYSAYGGNVRYVGTYGNVPTGYFANNSDGVAPACNIALDEDYKFNGQVLHVRDQISVTKGNQTLVFDVIGIDHDEVHFDKTTTNIYLPEPIKKVGDEAEYIDFGEQKQYFADGTSIDITLPTLPTFSGTNMLSVGTEVQPSNVYVKGKIKEIN